jgi:hypothetical protein
MIATRLAVTPWDVRLSVFLGTRDARLAGFEDLRVGMNAHAQCWNRLEDLPEEEVTLSVVQKRMEWIVPHMRQ